MKLFYRPDFGSTPCAPMVPPPALLIAGVCLPALLAGARIGVHVSEAVSEQTYRTLVLFLLLGSNVVPIGQGGL